MLLLGNDIVSLKHAGIRNKFQHTRFVDRVFTPSEKSTILTSSFPDITLWTMWAAKEAAYKVTSKIKSTPVFSHKKFKVLGLGEIDPGHTDVCVEFSEKNFSGYAEITEDVIHVVLGSESFSQSEVLVTTHLMSEEEKEQWMKQEVWTSYFSKEEMESIHHRESAFIRYLCKNKIANLINCDPSQVQIIRPTIMGKSEPPFVLIDNQPSNIDISLSHHESWLALVINPS